MFSATENIISSWDSYHHHHHHYHHYHDNHQLHDHQQQQQLQENPPLKLDLDGKKAIKVSSKTVEEDREVVKILRRKRPTREETQMVISRVCSDCGTNKTPLWRSGPAGPKSLCNACGIRNRKRRRREFEAIEMMRDISMNENQRHDNEDDEEENERVSLLLQRKFAGKEEAEAALLLMALSCGIYVHS